MNTKIIILAILISLMMQGCIIYQTQSTDIPLISKKNDLRIDAVISLVPLASATISYGLTDKIAIQGYGSIGTDDSYYFQAATGLYKANENNRVLELYGGFGYGYGTSYNDANPGHLLGNYQLYFGQLNYGKIATGSSRVELALGIKAGYFYSNLTDQNFYFETSATGPYKTYHDGSLLIEPTGIIRLGGGKLKFSIKLGGTKIFKFTNTNKNIPYCPLNIGVGLNYRL